ncbi:MAG: hypothetical protein ACRY3E_02725 [Candidatus Lariskella arthropodorum]
MSTNTFNTGIKESGSTICVSPDLFSYSFLSSFLLPIFFYLQI